MKFYWNDQDYVFDPKKRYLIYYVGNFSPVTKGHFSVLQKYIGNKNVKYFISQIGSEKRHGVPYKLSRKMWQYYIETLSKSEQSRIKVEKLHHTEDVERHLNSKIDVVIYIRGNEEKHLMVPRTKENDRDFKIFEKKFIQDRYKLIEIANKNRIGVDFIIMSRKGHVSATNFTLAVKNGLPYSEIKQYVAPLVAGALHLSV